MVKYNKQNIKKVQEVQKELNDAELVHSDEEIKELCQASYTPTESDIMNYTFRFGMYKGHKAIDVINMTPSKVNQSGINYTERTGYKYIKFLLKELNLLSRDNVILTAILRRYYAMNTPQSK